MLAQGFGEYSSKSVLIPQNTDMMIVTSYSGLLATRFFLGLAEAGIFPGSEFPQMLLYPINQLTPFQVST